MHPQEKGESKYLKSWRSLRKQSLCIIQRSTNFACDSRIPLNHKISYHSNILNCNYSQTISASLDPWHWLVLQLNTRAFCKLLKQENIPRYHVTPRAHKDRNQMQRRNDPRHRRGVLPHFLPTCLSSSIQFYPRTLTRQIPSNRCRHSFPFFLSNRRASSAHQPNKLLPIKLSTPYALITP